MGVEGGAGPWRNKGVSHARDVCAFCSVYACKAACRGVRTLVRFSLVSRGGPVGRGAGGGTFQALWRAQAADLAKPTPGAARLLAANTGRNARAP